MGFKTLPHIFWMKFYLKMWRILMIFFSWEMFNVLWVFCPRVYLLTFSFHTTIFFSFSFMFFLASIDRKVVQVCGDIMGPGFWEFFQGPLVKRQAWLPIYFGGISLLSMEDCAPSTFLGSWAFVASYLCFRFCIFDKLVLEEYVCLGWKGTPPALIIFMSSTRWPFSNS